jgi:phosphomannomutase/phosphoglucomutase
MMNRNAFREYDIRGDADRDLPDDVVNAIGYSIGEQAIGPDCDGSKAIVVGRDCRLTSPRIFAAITDGLRAWAHVIDLGVIPTPVAYFAQQRLLPAATVMITGSHNPAMDNGLKIMIGDKTLHGEAIVRLRDRVEARFQRGMSRPAYSLSHPHDITPAYLDHAVESLRLGPRRLKVVVDAGNGAGGPAAVALYTRLGFDVVPLYCEMDGRFPNHHPDPTQPENLSDLIMAVQSLGAELGIALDGDADRLGAVDATGRILWGDQLMILLGRAVLKEVPDARFVGEVKCSQAMYDALPSCEMWRVGLATSSSLIAGSPSTTGSTPEHGSSSYCRATRRHSPS